MLLAVHTPSALLVARKDKNFLASVKISAASGSATFGYANANFSVYKPYKEPIPKEMNNDDLNLHSMTKLSGWLRY